MATDRKIAFDPRCIADGSNADGWQPVRLPGPEQSRSADFPPLDTFVSREEQAMVRWCERHCRGPFHHQPAGGDGHGDTTFWFRDDADARAFAVTWFPYKCI